MGIEQKLLEMDEQLLVTCTCDTALSNFHVTYPGRRTGRSGPIAWPPCATDLNLLDFFFGDHMKSLVYETPVGTVEDINALIILASLDIGYTSDLLEGVR
ncbi:hypothetical protein TNCV_2118921 [Trichonephila clavipes]|nr:hypothetical protein TNCV_2118921 [Trichonephila clavipes]